MENLLLDGANLEIPDFVREFLRFHGEALMIANIISDKIISITLRSMSLKKEFSKIGYSKNMLYGLGQLDKNFKLRFKVWNSYEISTKEYKNG